MTAPKYIEALRDLMGVMVDRALCNTGRPTGITTLTIQHKFSLSRILLLSLLPFLITACGAVYRPSPFWGAGGYSSKDIDATTVRVEYLTSRTADLGTVRNYAFYRCAEITLERGYDGFFVLKGGANSVGGSYGYSTMSTITMRMFKGTPDSSKQPKNSEGVYYAEALKNRLEPSIKR